MIQFNIKKDICAKALIVRAKAEAIAIHSKPSTRKNRSLNEIIATCMYGHAAEIFLLSKDYIDDNRKYKDLFEPTQFGASPIEVKVTRCESNVEYVLKRCAYKILYESWMKHPERVYVFINDKRSDIYLLDGIYDWNGSKFDKFDIHSDALRDHLNVH